MPIPPKEAVPPLKIKINKTNMVCNIENEDDFRSPRTPHNKNKN